MKKTKQELQELLLKHREYLQKVQLRIAQFGGQEPLELSNKQIWYEEQIEDLEAKLDEIGDAEEYIVSAEESAKSAATASEKINHRISRLRAFRDTALQIREIAATTADYDRNLSQRFSFLFSEVAPYLLEVLIDFGYEKKKVSESVLKFVTASPLSQSDFFGETNEGLCFIEIVLRHHELMLGD